MSINLVDRTRFYINVSQLAFAGVIFVGGVGFYRMCEGYARKTGRTTFEIMREFAETLITCAKK